jgi:alkylation response protein AidB-like acyl-CoA dehydrogenase
LATPCGWSAEIWSELSALGLLAAPLPEKHGGLGGDGGELLILMGGFGRALLVEPYISSAVIGGKLFTELRDGQKLEAIARGEMRLALAHDEGPFDHGSAAAMTTAAAVEGGFELSGRKILVRDAPSATHLIVSAHSQDDRLGQMLFLVPVDARGIVLHTYRAIDGGLAADIAFDALIAPSAALLCSGAGTVPLIRRLLDDATVAICAEAIGVMRQMLEQTIAYTNQREQFGRLLSSFQVLRHRLVDMLIEVEQAHSLTLRAALTRDNSAVVSAAKIRVNAALRIVAQGAVQLHGGIGTTQELQLGQYFRRATAIERQYGTTAQHYRRLEQAFAAELESNACPGLDQKRVAGDGTTAKPSACADDAFRMEVRDFLEEAFTSELRAESDRQTGIYAAPALATKWHRILYEKGWVAPSWPVIYGGTGWTLAQRGIFEHECARVNTPVLSPLALQMCGPVLIEHGTPEQKDFFLPRILSGEHRWCQGYSEPNAGSDLANLKTRAVRDGDHYIVNGTKIWTTYAHAANWIFMLVRTNSQVKPQAGISFLLVSLDSPGLTITPIRSISGEHEVNQLFFDEVRVPAVNLVGAENHGWTVAKFLLEFERGGGSATMRARRVIGLLRRLVLNEGGLAPDILHRLARLEIEIDATDWTQRRMLTDIEVGGSVGNANASILKLKASELYQEASSLYYDALGAWGLAEQRAALDGNGEIHGPAHAITGAARYMNSRAMSIFGGSSEIQREIIAKTILRP